eukprot:3282792-Pyramimonas_sp.AAC.1
MHCGDPLVELREATGPPLKGADSAAHSCCLRPTVSQLMAEWYPWAKKPGMAVGAPDSSCRM